MDRHDWEPVTKGKLVGFAAGFALFLVLIFTSEPGFVFVLDHANLLFHEAGHPIVGLLSARLEPYGGTIGQLAFPAILMALFWRRGQPLNLAGSCLWFLENWLNIARYVADARALALPLVGGGDHDWNTILSRWGWLAYDTRIAHAMVIFAWTGMALVCGAVVWLAWRTRMPPCADSAKEEPVW